MRTYRQRTRVLDYVINLRIMTAEIKLQMTWSRPILYSIISDCPGLSLFALNYFQVSIFLFWTKDLPDF